MHIIDQASSIQIIATLCFLLALIHTFSVKFFQKKAHQYPEGSVGENFFHFLGEVEVVFGIWAGLFILFYILSADSSAAIEYLESRSFTEPMLVFVLMALCATRPILNFATAIIQFFSKLLPLNKQVAFYVSTLVLGPVLGSFITEPAAMTVTALILLQRFYKHNISDKLKYATLGLLFVNVSIGGTLTSFAAPPVLMVAHKWGWDTFYMLTHFGWKSVLSVVISTLIVAITFKNELSQIREDGSSEKDIHSPSPWWVTLTHLVFLGLIIMTHHHPSLFVPLFLFFLGFAAVTQEHQSDINLKSPLLVGFFLGGLIVLGGMQEWWLNPVLQSLDAFSLYMGAMGLTAITDNAAITYLGSQVEGLSEFSKYALVSGSVIGGGLTVIANAPNPAGYSILNSTFGRDGISAWGLFKSAVLPTVLAALIFWVL